MTTLLPAVQLFTLREYTQTEEDLAMTFKRVREEMDCDIVQLSRIGTTIPADFITNLCKEYDMTICVTHTPMERIFNDLSQVIKEHKAWGCDAVGLGNLDASYIDEGYDGYVRFLKDMEPVIAELKANDMVFAYHSHTYEFVRHNGNGRLIYDLLVEDTDPETFHFIQDSFWMKYGGINHPHYIRKVKDRMEVLHVKDFTLTTDYFTDSWGLTGTIGEGNINYGPVFDACEEAGVKYLAIEQDVCARDPFDCLKDALVDLRWQLANR